MPIPGPISSPDYGGNEHSKALDGIRGIAILLVILFHSMKLYCGWMGVQVFFVLSGFLITTILLRDSDLPLGFYLKRFYWRRSLRIFPLYYSYLILLTIAYFTLRAPEPTQPFTRSVWLLPVPQTINAFAHDWPYLFTYTLNFRRILPNFGGSPYYGRFWSLAVEEQFYIVWPLLLYRFPRKRLGTLVVAVLAFSPLFRWVVPYLLAPMIQTKDAMGAAIYYLTPSQIDGFAVGAAIVLWGKRWRSLGVPIFIGCSLLFLICGQANSIATTGRWAFNTGFGYEVNMMDGLQHVWGYTVINLWAGSLIIVALSRNWISRLLAHPWLVYFGKISYGMYVYHHVILFIGIRCFGNRPNTRLGFLIYFACVIIVSDLSFRLFESKILKLKEKKFTRPKRLAKAAGAAGNLPLTAASPSFPG